MISLKVNFPHNERGNRLCITGTMQHIRMIYLHIMMVMMHWHYLRCRIT